MRLRGWFLLFLGACGDDDVPPAPSPTPTATATPATDAAPPLSLVMTPDVAVSHLCARVTLARSDGAAFPAGEIAIATDPSTRTFDAETDCAGASTPVRVPAGATSKTFFVRTASESPVTLTATAPFASGSVTFAPKVFLTLGQPDARTILARRDGMRGPLVAQVQAGKLFVAESGNPSLRIWNTVPTRPDEPPSLVLGQPTTSAHQSNDAPTPSAVGTVGGVWTDGTRLVVSDQTHHRVLVWTTFPTENGQPASFALGQPDLTSAGSNAGGVSGSSLNEARGVYSDGTRLFVADTRNGRVLVWSTFPTASGQSATFALGQAAGAANLTSSAFSGDGAGMSGPAGIASCGGNLFVADAFDHRVLRFAGMPSAPVAATFALGQPPGVANLTSFAENAGGLGAGLFSPLHIACDDTHLAVSDFLNHRVVVWNTLPSTGGTPPTFALGQPDLLSGAENAGGIRGSTLYFPSHTAFADGKLLVADYGNHRVLVWNALPDASGTSASFAIGQPTGPANLTTADSLVAPVNGASGHGAMATDGTRLVVASTEEHRVLVWNQTPSSPSESAAFALGQPAGPSNLTSRSRNAGGVSASSLHGPDKPAIIAGRLFVPDALNHRVLVWNAVPTAGGQPADYVLGQTSFTATTTAATAAGMGTPAGVASDGTRLFVVDRELHRVLVWNTIPTVTGTAADYVLGQPGFSSSATEPVSGASMNRPDAVRVIGGRLFVADAGNHRVLVWNTIPTVTGTPADFALGQPDLVSRTESPAGASTLRSPRDIAGDATTLYVADAGNHRVLRWSPLPTAFGAAAADAVGQPDLVSGTSNQGGGPSASVLDAPASLFVEPTRLWTWDAGNSRVLLTGR